MEDSQKRTLLIAAVVIAIIIILLLLIRACVNLEEYRIDDEDADTDITEETDEIRIEDIDIPPPTAANFETGMEELSAFILANTDFSCTVLQNPKIAQNTELAEETARTSYANYGFPINDTPTMMEILEKYENIEEVTQIIRRNVENCD